jgi:hypothetical protein
MGQRILVWWGIPDAVPVRELVVQPSTWEYQEEHGWPVFLGSEDM